MRLSSTTLNVLLRQPKSQPWFRFLLQEQTTSPQAQKRTHTNDRARTNGVLSTLTTSAVARLPPPCRKGLGLAFNVPYDYRRARGKTMPAPGPNRSSAAGVGNWDEIVRVGDWDVGRRPPLALGVEAAGIVDAVGEDVTSLERATKCSPTHCRCDTRAGGRSGLSLRPHLSRGSRARFHGRKQPRSRCPRLPPTRRSPKPHLSQSASGFSGTAPAA
jgi:hypothetical protein